MEGNGALSVTGYLRGVLYRKKRFVVGLVDVEETLLLNPRRFVLPQGGNIVVGQNYRFSGRLIINRHYGTQFQVDHHELLSATPTHRPIKREAPLLAALKAGEVPGIGADTGARLVQGFGEDLLTMRDAHPLTCMTGIGERRAFSILANIKRYIDGTDT